MRDLIRYNNNNNNSDIVKKDDAECMRVGGERQIQSRNKAISPRNERF